jgi:hypothetical protein
MICLSADFAVPIKHCPCAACREDEGEDSSVPPLSSACLADTQCASDASPDTTAARLRIAAARVAPVDEALATQLLQLAARHRLRFALPQAG